MSKKNNVHTLNEKTLGVDQDGHLGECGTHLPPQTHKTYISCGEILTENKLETGSKTFCFCFLAERLYTTKAIRKIQ